MFYIIAYAVIFIVHSFLDLADNNCMEILLSKIMHKRNLTVRQVEQMTKVPKSTINDIMNGKSPRLDTLEQLAAGLKVKISDLYDSPYK